VSIRVGGVSAAWFYLFFDVIMKNQLLYIVMVGLPARGKSTIAGRLKENLVKDSIKTRIFNNGDLRRRWTRQNTSYAEFYDPKNKEGVALRERIALINLERAKNYLSQDGEVAILDATNVSTKRRDTVIRSLNQHPILFIECINGDQQILEASIQQKIALPEFSHLEEKDAILSFTKRID